MALAGLFHRKTPEQLLRQNQRALNKVCKSCMYMNPICMFVNLSRLL